MRGQSIWGALAANDAVAGAIPYMGTDGNWAVQYGDFFFRDSDSTLHVGCDEDFHQTDALNIVGAYGSYMSNASMSVANNILSQHKVSSSRGTGAAPTILTNGDVVGQFAGYAYAGATPAYVLSGAIRVVVNGADANSPGGALQFVIKADAGSAAVAATMTPSAFSPEVDGAMNLGAPSKGFKKIYPESTGSATPTNGSQTINKTAGKFKIAAGQQSVTITNDHVGANDIVLPVVMSDDSTAKSVVITVAGGSFTAKLNAAATADTTIGFLLINFS